MQNITDTYSLWSTDSYFDKSTREELEKIRADSSEIEERFYRDLEFGTGGLRGIIGAGTNRMNVYTIRKVSAGLAEYIKSQGVQAMQRGVAISFDSRHFSDVFAQEAAGVLNAYGVKVYLSDALRPVPVLSFAVRHYNTFSGIMITASHNPPKYNGFKVYGEDGAQLTPEAAEHILEHRNSIDDIRTIVPMSQAEAITSDLLKIIGEDLDTEYTDMLAKLVIDQEAIEQNKDIPIVFTPLHGSANRPVQRILSHIGFSNVSVVKEQEEPDGRFPTVKAPNPEDPNALQMGIEQARQNNAEIVIGTDPDGDRLGVAVRKNEESGVEYVCLTGNQIGLLLLDYILEYKSRTNTLPKRSFAVTTIVSSRLTAAICAHYGVELQEVLTGFKFIGERIKIFDEQGDMHFQFGFEESYGYLSGVDVRDKDAVVAAMLLAGMAAQSRGKGQTLIDRLENLYVRFGYGYEDAVSFTLEGKAGVEQIAGAMSSLRKDAQFADALVAKSLVPDFPILAIRDYKTSKRYDFSGQGVRVDPIDLPESDVLLFEIGGEKGLDWACVRPSGTEPKLKVYFGAYTSDKSDAQYCLDKMKQSFSGYVKRYLYL